MSENKDPNRLIERVDALMRRQQEDTQRAVEEVPLLTEVVDHEARKEAGEHDASAEEALAADIERVMLVRLIPELNRQIGAMRGELEKELRRAVREAVAHALETRKKPGGGI